MAHDNRFMIASKTRCFYLLGALLLSVNTARATVLDDIGRSVSSLWTQRAQKSSAAEAARSKAKAQSQQVEFLHDRLERTQQLLQRANTNYLNYFRQMRRTEAQIIETRHRAQMAEARYKAHKIQFGRRLASMQRHGETNYLQIALGSTSLADLTRRTAFFQALTQRDAYLQDEIKSDKEELLKAQNELMSQWNERNRLQIESNRERERIAEGEREQRQMWRQLNNSRLALFNYALAQERSSQEISRMIGSLQSRRSQIIATYNAQAARERAQIRAQATFRARERRRVVRAYPPRRSERRYSTRNYSNRTYGSNRNYRSRRYTRRSNRQNGRSNFPNFAPRVDVMPQYAPRIELAPMPIEALQNPGGWRLPARGRLSSRYGMRRHPTTGRHKLHTGHDIAAPHGSPIRAARAGRVLWAGWKKAYGNTVIVDVGGGMTTLYGHASRLSVRAGQPVKAGQTLGGVGSTGFSTGPHLHFEIRKKGRPIDPGNYLHKH